MTLEGRYNMATLLGLQGRFEDALAMDEVILESKRRSMGDAHLATLLSLHAVAQGHNRLGRPEVAEPLFREVLKGRELAMEPHHVEVLLARSELAHCLLAQGHFDDALTLYEGAHRLSKAKHGEDHWLTIQMEDNAGRALRSLGRVDEAITCHRNAVRLASATLGPENEIGLTARAQLALALEEAAQAREAVEVAEEVLRLASGAGLEGHSSLRSARLVLVRLYATDNAGDLRDLDRALELGQDATTHEYGVEMGEWTALADVRTARGEFDEAVAAFSLALELAPQGSVDAATLEAARAAAQARAGR